MQIDLNALPDDAALLQQMLRTVLLLQSELHGKRRGGTIWRHVSVL